MANLIDSDFVKFQKARIEERLDRYNNLATIREQLRELGDLTLYQKYKIHFVSDYLRRALKKIQNGTYGICEVCGKEISRERLNLVPGALAHVHCDEQKN